MNTLRLLATAGAVIFCVHSIAQPKITSFSPASGVVGSTVVITGSNFNTSAQSNTVYFGSVKAAVLSANGTSISVKVPAGATFKPLSVTSNGLTGYAAKPFITKFAGGSNLILQSFKSPVNAEVGNLPYGVAIADFDNDGKPDVAIANDLAVAPTVTILRNTSLNGVLSFAPKQSLGAAMGPYSVTTADVDGDGKLDMLVPNVGDNNISVFRNTSTPGAISFAARKDFAVGSSPYYVAAGDLDGDGKPDFAVANYFSGSVSILKNNSSPGIVALATKKDLTTPAGVRWIAIGDLNADGKPDMATANDLSNSLSFFRNTSSLGSISFAARTDQGTTQPKPQTVSINEFTQDQKPDVYHNTENGDAYILQNNSTASSLAFSYYRNTGLSASGSYQLALADLNGDGNADAVFSRDNALEVVQNNGATGWGYHTLIRGISPYGIDVADLNGDNQPDIAVSNFTSDKLSVYINRCTEPGIRDLSNNSGKVGDPIWIYGVNFSNVSSITFGGIPVAAFTVNSPTEIKVTLGNGASGDVMVVTNHGTATLSGFIYNGPPIITSFSPKIAGRGDTVKITGYNMQNATAVLFGDSVASYFKSVSPTLVKAVVGAAASGNITVKNMYGSGILAGFQRAYPEISSFSPQTAKTGDTVTIQGKWLANITHVQFGGTLCAGFRIVSATKIKAAVRGGSSGKVTVTSLYGIASRDSFHFVLPAAPAVVSFFPKAARPDTIIEITGSNFNPNPKNNIVVFGGVKTAALSATSTLLRVKVPYGAMYDRITVIDSTTGLMGSSLACFTPSFHGKGAITATAFSSASTLHTVSRVDEIAVADLDGDKSNDLLGVVSLYSWNNLLSMYRVISSPGSISFDTAKNITSFYGEKPYAYDLDGDTKSDVFNLPGGSLTTPPVNIFVRKNVSSKGNIKLATADSFVCNSASGKIMYDDFDSDGRPDLATNFDNKVSILRNTSVKGYINFSDSELVNVSPYYYAHSVAGDINGDGKADFVSLFSDSALLAVTVNSSTVGHLSCSPPVVVPTARKAEYVKLLDVDQDGKLDIVMGSSDSTVVAIYLNISTVQAIKFASPYRLQLPEPTGNVQMADLDGDGTADLIITAFWQGQNYLVSNKSTPGNISLKLRPGYTPISGWYTYVADMNKDQRPDIVYSDINGAIVILWNQQPFQYRQASGSERIFSASNTSVDQSSLVYPNPARDEITINKRDVTALRVTDGWGRERLVKSFAPSAYPMLDISTLHAGIYWLQIVDKAGEKTKVAFVVSR